MIGMNQQLQGLYLAISLIIAMVLVFTISSHITIEDIKKHSEAELRAEYEGKESGGLFFQKEEDILWIDGDGNACIAKSGVNICRSTFHEVLTEVQFFIWKVGGALLIGIVGGIVGIAVLDKKRCSSG